MTKSFQQRSATAVISLSANGALLARKLCEGLNADFYLHESADLNAEMKNVTRFTKVIDLTADIFSCYKGLIYIMPCGVVARAIAPLLQSKLTDPAVVVLDVPGRYAISFLSGHEGGANDLALKAANLCGAEPIITTTTEAEKTVICGIGCRKGIDSQTITEAISMACKEAAIRTDDIRLLCTIKLKEYEPGLVKAAQQLSLPLRIIPDHEIIHSTREFDSSDFVKETTGLPAVAEPCALLGGRRTEFLLKRITHNGVTIALARESCG